jgi:hypothetical protein
MAFQKVPLTSGIVGTILMAADGSSGGNRLRRLASDRVVAVPPSGCGFGPADEMDEQCWRYATVEIISKA